MRIPRTKEQLVALLDGGESALDRAGAVPQRVVSAEVGREGDEVREVRVLEKAVGRVGARRMGALGVRNRHRGGVQCGGRG